MKATKMRNAQIYRASLGTRSRQMGSPLSKELQKKYGKRSVRVATGDSVKVMRGEYKDVDGKITSVSTQSCGVMIEGIKKEKKKGDKFDVVIHASNVMVTDLNTEDSWRTAKLEGKPARRSKKPEKADADGKTAKSEVKPVRRAKKPETDADSKEVKSKVKTKPVRRAKKPEKADTNSKATTKEDDS